MRHGSLILFLIFLAGCSWFGGPRPAAEAPRPSTLSIQVIKPGALARGGALKVEPLTAGSEAEASAILDRTVLLITDGIAQELAASESRLRFHSGAGDPDFLMTGHVEKMKRPSRADRLLMKNMVTIGVRAEIRAFKSGELIALIFDERKIKNHPRFLERGIAEIGREIAAELVRQELL